jgi:hypothetical protein
VSGGRAYGGEFVEFLRGWGLAWSFRTGGYDTGTALRDYLEQVMSL